MISRWRRMAILASGLGVLAVVNFAIYQKEQLLKNGRVVFLELAPVDPRSMMQGDYMALRFSLQNAIQLDSAPQEGRIVVKLDERKIARFARLDDGKPLASDEAFLYYRVRESQVKFATNAFFFQERTADTYLKARYGEARVAPDGQMLIVGLRDADLKTLGVRLSSVTDSAH